MLDQTPGEAGPARDKSIGELFGELAQEVGSLVRQEVALAKVEMSRKAAEAGKSAGMVAAGGTLAHAGLLAVIAGVILALGMLIPLWGAALIVGVVVLAVGAALAEQACQGSEELGPGATRDTRNTQGGCTMGKRAGPVKEPPSDNRAPRETCQPQRDVGTGWVGRAPDCGALAR